MIPPRPENQHARAAEIERFDLGRGLYADGLEGMLHLAREVTECPVAMVSIIRDDGQFAEAALGEEMEVIPLEGSICAHTILEGHLVEIADCRLDPWGRDSCLGRRAVKPIRFYAAAQIVTRKGIVLGTFCVMDYVPRVLNQKMRNCLRTLADQTMRALEAAQAARASEEFGEAVEHFGEQAISARGAALDDARPLSEFDMAEERQMARQRTGIIGELLAELHRHARSAQTIDLGGYLESVMRRLARLAPSDVSIDIDVDSLVLPSNRAVSVGVMLTELVSTIFTTTLAQGRAQRLELRAMNLGGMYRVDCLDDVPGETTGIEGTALPDDDVLSDAVTRLHGTLRASRRDDGLPGKQTTLVLPLAA